MKSKFNWLLKSRISKVFLILVTFFVLNISVNAASFAYDAFDWEKFYEENKDYWGTYCQDYEDEMSESECIEVLLSGKKEYYTRLYKLLAKYEKKGYRLDDNIFIATAFYGLTPDTFTELPEEYQKLYKNGSAYNLDLDEDLDAYNVDTIEGIDYYQQEKDSLKTLIKNMFAYKAQCVGPVGTPQVDEEGNTVCYQGTLSGDKCIGTIANYELNFFEYLIEKFDDIVSILGISLNNEKREECFSKGGTDLQESDTKVISEAAYWEFLEESTYFDNKLHLQYKFRSILNETNHKYMSELTEDEREEYNDEIVAARKRLVKEIKSVLKTYESSKANNNLSLAGCNNASAWWPIGSDETTKVGDVEIASGDPVTVRITSPFGYRIHPVYGTRRFHSGIDISGNIQAGVTNIIAVKDGTVVLAGSNGGYGQCVIIQHNDGTYSLYGHLYSNSITVNVNDSVVQGQVIGKIGSTGVSTGPHLHFEIRQGANSSANAADPLNYVSADNPRNGGGGICSGSSSEFTKMLHWFEGTGNCASKTNGSNYVIHNDGKGYPTVGYGIALVYNIDRFKNYGYDVTNMTFGQELPIEIVDKVEEEEVAEKRSYVNNYLAKYSLTMTDYQIDALTMIAYQFGNLGNLNTTYSQYGNTESLRQYTHNQSGSWYYFKENPSTANGRADANWKLFHEGIYTYGEACN